jgi:hypothetical protein
VFDDEVDDRLPAEGDECPVEQVEDGADGEEDEPEPQEYEELRGEG